MLIERIVLHSAKRVNDGFIAEVEFETEDGFGFSGDIEFDHEFNYKLGFLNTFVTTDEDKFFINEVLTSEDFKNDVYRGVALSS